MLAVAVDDGIIASNPVAGLGKALRLSRKPVDADADEEIKAMDRTQLAAFLGAVPDRYYPLFLTMARTGVRVGEAVAFQWDDIDLTGATARICRNLSRGRLGSPNGNRARSVDLSPELADVLRHELLARKKAALASGRPMAPWCFPTSTRTPFDDGKIRLVMRRTMKRAGPPTHFSPHCLRHTYASILLSEGESPAYIQRQLGHRS